MSDIRPQRKPNKFRLALDGVAPDPLAESVTESEDSSEAGSNPAIPPRVITYLCPGCDEDILIPAGSPSVRCQVDGNDYPWPDIVVHTVQELVSRAEEIALGYTV